ncbi:ArsR/SmtB family transcription factor [Corynebacterium phoceense]|uniref:ArsR/SmtB family transcription factor n=1 Tax=Corynebacterium phoceense TaxID=1686286 RepID=UPI001D4A2144|nr:metalloregulator ArsR/SmtB family transcription factor [Corynebacterium phoceense]MCQ9332679.1 metalloregulator ArsR/SmtB family transcription factor [Corynebacterium phoceense]MCQ9335755.1 metalloregulator ArsR/SmtB family transcription factor [Corynebacterium phoceense]HJG43617.1 metalloregulator ArsR/SmtB family transcription factor [Corynebacterium phoceense]
MNSSPEIPLRDISEPCCSLGEGLLEESDAARFAALFGLLADPTRLRLLSQIADAGCAPMSIGDLVALTGLTQPTVSHHLKRLTEAGLLTRTKEGRTVTHAVVPEAFAELRSVLQIG